jgi:hypothetical protein
MHMISWADHTKFTFQWQRLSATSRLSLIADEGFLRMQSRSRSGSISDSLRSSLGTIRTRLSRASSEDTSNRDVASSPSFSYLLRTSNDSVCIGADFCTQLHCVMIEQELSLGFEPFSLRIQIDLGGATSVSEGFMVLFRGVVRRGFSSITLIALYLFIAAWSRRNFLLLW